MLLTLVGFDVEPDNMNHDSEISMKSIGGSFCDGVRKAIELGWVGCGKADEVVSNFSI
ncbi:MAG: hypothetical protein ACON4O_00965 [Lentimonas sp.]